MLYCWVEWSQCVRLANLPGLKVAPRPLTGEIQSNQPDPMQTGWVTLAGSDMYLLRILNVNAKFFVKGIQIVVGSYMYMMPSIPDQALLLSCLAAQWWLPRLRGSPLPQSTDKYLTPHHHSCQCMRLLQPAGSDTDAVQKKASVIHFLSRYHIVNRYAFWPAIFCPSTEGR